VEQASKRNTLRKIFQKTDFLTCSKQVSKKLNKNENLERFSGKNCFFDFPIYRQAGEREWKKSKKIISSKKTAFLDTLQ
jgi:hypothetical protein